MFAQLHIYLKFHRRNAFQKNALKILTENIDSFALFPLIKICIKQAMWGALNLLLWRAATFG